MKLKMLILPVSILCLPLAAETVQVYLGVFDAAGLPPEELPVRGAVLRRETPASPLTDSRGREAGYIPAVFRESLRSMRADGVRLTFEVRHLYHHPLPGRFVQIEVWAETDTPEHIRPLQYSLPVHPDPETLAGQ